jgi:hypothetical protein
VEHGFSIKGDNIMSIVKEHYRDFVGTLSVRITELSAQLESMDFTEETWLEYGMINHELQSLTRIQEHFADSSRWAEFETLESLKTYIQTIKCAYESIDAYSKSVLPNCKTLIGITHEEWDKLEETRYRLLNTLETWHLFADFCENGTI